MTRSIALISTLLVLAIAAPASAQSGAFGPLPPAAPTPTPTMTSTTTTDTGETSRTTLILIGVALIVGFGVMGWLVMRDARRRAPEIVTAGPAIPEGTGARKPHTAAAKKKMRAKTRAQKRARKAHRR